MRWPGVGVGTEDTGLLYHSLCTGTDARTRTEDERTSMKSRFILYPTLLIFIYENSSCSFGK